MLFAIFFGAFTALMTESTISYEECVKHSELKACSVEKVLRNVCLESGRKVEECK